MVLNFLAEMIVMPFFTLVKPVLLFFGVTSITSLPFCFGTFDSWNA